MESKSGRGKQGCFPVETVMEGTGKSKRGREAVGSPGWRARGGMEIPLWRTEDNGHRELLGMAPPGDTRAVWDLTNNSSHAVTIPGGALWELL